MSMIDWLYSVIGNVSFENEFIVDITACVLVVILVTNVINLFFSPFRSFK